MWHLFRWVSPALLGLIVPELWQDAFAWLRESGYQPHAQAVCVCWVVFVAADSLPVATARRQSRAYQVISTIVVMLVCGAAWWLLVGRTRDEPTEPKSDSPAQYPTSIRLKFSQRQTLQVSNVPGTYRSTLDLDSVATLLLIGPFGRDAVTLTWPSGPVVSIDEPRADEKYKIPGGVGQTLSMPQAGKGIEMRGLTLIGPARHIPFDLSGNRVHFLQASDRIFRVSLDRITDKANSERQMFFEYEFSIYEEDSTEESRKVAIEPPPTPPPSPKPTPETEGVRQLLNALNTQPVGTIILGLRESEQGRPNIVSLRTGTTFFLFDPVERTVTFRMVTTDGRNINLKGTLDKPNAEGIHRIAVVWDTSKGARLHWSNEGSARDGLD